MSTKLFVGSLPWSVNDQKLKETFEKHGTVVSAKIVMDHDTNRSRVLDLLKWKILQMQAMLLKH